MHKLCTSSTPSAILMVPGCAGLLACWAPYRLRPPLFLHHFVGMLRRSSTGVFFYALLFYLIGWLQVAVLCAGPVFRAPALAVHLVPVLP